MASVVIGVKTDEIAIQDPEQDLTTDGKDPNEVVGRQFRPPSARNCEVNVSPHL